MSDKTQLERAKCPEEVGVDSEEIVRFLDDMKENNLEFHSFMVIRKGKVACEFYRPPFNAQTPHACYSVSKSFTALAVGLAIQENLFSLDTRLVDVFPEYDNGDKRLGKITVRHLITMTAGKAPSVFADKGKIDWIEDFFSSGWYGEPGTFRYVNENIFMLCAIIRRITGLTVREFLTPRFFEPLGIDVPFWETNQDGTEAGGWGIYVKLEDLAKLMYCYQQGGMFNGKRILSEDWVKEATQAHADNGCCKPLDNNKGYCYCFWRNGGDLDSYRADGMFSQFGIVFEKEDALVISMGGIADEQEARDCIWRHFPKAFIEPNKKAKKSPVEDFYDLGEKYSLDNPNASKRVPKEEILNKSTIKLRKKILLNIVGFPVSVLPLAVSYMTTDKAGNINDINFDFSENKCEMSWTEGDETNTVSCGMDGHLLYGNMTLGGIDYLVCSSCEWIDENELKVTIRPVTTVSKRILDFKFNGESKVLMKPSSTPAVDKIMSTLLVSLSEIMPDCSLTDKFIELAGKTVKFIPNIIEPVHKGKVVKRK